MKLNLEKETALVETVLFLESEPVSVDGIAGISQLAKDVVEACLDALREKYAGEDSGIELAMITGGWTLVPKKEFWDALKERYGNKHEGRLSR
ncbi:MAG: SMC-Scp complex subunit ScpB, partial [Treponemataceae bacterium]|nr:SMC-Scp complex subunit ScpB [Treponemataceae bacterium]